MCVQSAKRLAERNNRVRTRLEAEHVALPEEERGAEQRPENEQDHDCSRHRASLRDWLMVPDGR